MLAQLVGLLLAVHETAAIPHPILRTNARPRPRPAGALTLLARLTPSELRSLLRLSAADIRGRLDGLRAALEQELGQDTVRSGFELRSFYFVHEYSVVA